MRVGRWEWGLKGAASWERLRIETDISKLLCVSIFFSWKISFLVLHGISFLKDTSWNGFFCNCPWVYCGPFPFLKEILFDCRASQGQWVYVDRSLLRRLVAKLFFECSSFRGFCLPTVLEVEENALDIYIIHAIDSIKSPWHPIKMSF